jgi:tripartite-type tricarboxylate transporter receptor subunit TctC
VIYSIRTLVAVLATVLAWTSLACAQDYPNRTVTIIVPYPAGGPTDQVARTLAPKFSEQLGQSFIVENVSGGATTIATTRVARAAADGYTLLLHNLQISANVSLYPNLSFDTEKALTPVGFINSNPLVLVGRKSLAANTLGELLTWMRTTPAKMGHFGIGSTAQLTTTLFAQEANVAIDQIPYRGAAPALQDMLGEHIDLMFATPQQVLGQVTSAQIKAYGITTAEASPLFPTADSLVREFGPKFAITYWHALFAPAGTPQPIIDKLNAVLQSAADDPSMARTWAESGVAPYPRDQRSPQAAQAMLRGEIARWSQVVRDNNIPPQTD